MFPALARFTYRRRWAVIALFSVLLPFALAGAGSVFSALAPGGFDDPGSESRRATAQIERAIGGGRADLIALYTAPDGQAAGPAAAAAISAATARAAAHPAVERAVSYFSTGAPQFLSRDRSRTFVMLTLRGNESERVAAVDEIRPLLAAEGLTLQVGGIMPVFEAVNTTVEHDLQRAESIAFPVTAVLLLIIFGTAVSAALPLVIGALAILCAFALLRMLALITDVSVFAINIVTLMGLGLAIDYALFIVNRYREEIHHRPPQEALVTTVATTGRAVAFSGVTVAASLAGLFIFPQTFLRSMALGGIAVTLVAVVLAVTLLPALIAVLGRRLEALRVPWLGAAAAATGEGGFWRQVAMTVMRRPLLIGAAVVALLVMLGLPFLRFRATGVDHRVLPQHIEARQVSDTLDREFQPHEMMPHQLAVISAGDILTAEHIGTLYDLVQAVAAAPGITRVDSIFSVVPGLSRTEYQALYSRPATEQPPALTAGLALFARGNSARISAISAHEADDPEALAQVQVLRALPEPPGMTVLTGGRPADLVDLKGELAARLPLMAAIIGGVMFVVLFLVFGSVTLPLKAMAMNLLSLSASFGALVWVFQDGRFEGMLGYTSTGGIDATNPVLMFAILFGLSMDYEVLLLSRVREEYDRTGDNTQAVARGLEKTGRLITSAALLLIIVIGSFATSDIVFIKQIGAGMALAIALDATIVRGLLVPAAMRLMGRWNWWAPAPLVALWRRAGLAGLEGGAHSVAGGGSERGKRPAAAGQRESAR